MGGGEAEGVECAGEHFLRVCGGGRTAFGVVWFGLAVVRRD